MNNANSQKRLDQISDLWEELEITPILEQHVPPHRRYLVDRLLRILAGVDEAGD